MRSKTQTKVAFSRAIRLAEMCALTGVSRATIWRLSKSDPSFPKPFKLSAAITCWDEAELMGWIAAKKNQ